MWDCVLDCFYFEQKTAYEMRISDWSSDVCASELPVAALSPEVINDRPVAEGFPAGLSVGLVVLPDFLAEVVGAGEDQYGLLSLQVLDVTLDRRPEGSQGLIKGTVRSEEHTSELKSLMGI